MDGALAFLLGLAIVTVLTVSLLYIAARANLPNWVIVILALMIGGEAVEWLIQVLDLPVFHGWLYEEPQSRIFVFITIVLGGAGAWMTGRACAMTWRPYAVLVVYLLLLTMGVRFLHMALFQGTLLSVHYFLVDLIYVQVVGALGFRRTRVVQMQSKYGWLFEAAGPFAWRTRSTSTTA